MDYASEKCCGGIAITELMGRDDYYIYRCLDRGLVGWQMDFSLGPDVQVSVNCDDSSSAAVVLAATVSAALTAVVTIV